MGGSGQIGQSADGRNEKRRVSRDTGGRGAIKSKGSVCKGAVIVREENRGK